MSKIKDTIGEEKIKEIELEEIDLDYKNPPSQEMGGYLSRKNNRKLKATYHFPTEQYGFVEVEEEVSSPEEAIQNYNASKRACEPLGQGLELKEWNRCVDEYLSTGSLINGTELYQQMSPSQQDWFQTTKRAMKRLNK